MRVTGPTSVLLGVLLAALSASALSSGVRSCGAVGLAPDRIAPSSEYETSAQLQRWDDLLERAYGFFDPSLQGYLRGIPILAGAAAQTSYSVYWHGIAFIVVSPDFFRTAAESRYWTGTYSRAPYDMSPDQPVFPDEFRLRLLVHELMHIVESHLGLDTAEFFACVEDWYLDDSFGRPVDGAPQDEWKPDPNRTKYVLWWYLFGQCGTPNEPHDVAWKRMDYCSRYRHTRQGVEEFAYIGDAILCPANTASRQARLAEIPDSILRFYRGIVHPAVLALRSPG